MVDKNLGFILEFSKGARMEHTVTIPLVQGSSFSPVFHRINVLLNYLKKTHILLSAVRSGRPPFRYTIFCKSVTLYDPIELP